MKESLESVRLELEEQKELYAKTREQEKDNVQDMKNHFRELVNEKDAKIDTFRTELASMRAKTTEARTVLGKAEGMRESLIAGITEQKQVIAKLRSETRARNQNLVDAEEMIVERDRKIVS